MKREYLLLLLNLTFLSMKKMLKKSFTSLFLCSLLGSGCFSGPVSRSIFNFTTRMQKSIIDDFNEKNDRINFSHQSLRHNSNVTTENNILSLTMSDLNTSDPNSELLIETETHPGLKAKTPNGNHENLDTINDTIYENNFMNHTKTDQTNKEHINDEMLFNASHITDSSIDEKIVLYRNNCNLEIPVQENQDLKIEIEFEKLENNTSGKCCITLNGEIGSLLGIVISNIHLYQNASQGEVIKVIIADYGSDFVLKEYYSWSKYQSLLMTETHKAYIVLHYEVKSVPSDEKNSHFNLEVFSYHKFENPIQHENSHYQSHSSHYNGVKNLSESSFFSYFHK